MVRSLVDGSLQFPEHHRCGHLLSHLLRLRRRRGVQIGAALYFTGALLAALAPTLWCVSLGFTTYGLGVGFGTHAATVDIAEIVPCEVRGMLVSAKQLIFVVGMLSGYFSCWGCLSLRCLVGAS